MRSLFLASAAALALGCSATVLTAQDSAAPMTVTLTVDQQAAYQGWPADRKTSYDAWPAPYQGYFWTLTTSQQTAWWMLSDEQRKQVVDMTPEQRVTAWGSIEAQVAAAPAPVATITEQVQANPVGSDAPATATPPNPAVAAAPVPPAMPADSSYNAGPYKGALTAAPAEAMNKEYPVCSRTVQDSCRNRGGV